VYVSSAYNSLVRVLLDTRIDYYSRIHVINWLILRAALKSRISERSNLDCVTPRSCGYGDVFVTYIRRKEIPSHIYAKDQYREESQYESIWCIIHSSIRVQLQSYHMI